MKQIVETRLQYLPSPSTLCEVEDPRSPSCGEGFPNSIYMLGFQYCWKITRLRILQVSKSWVRESATEALVPQKCFYTRPKDTHPNDTHPKDIR